MIILFYFYMCCPVVQQFKVLCVTIFRLRVVRHLVLQITVINVTGNCIQNAKVTSHIEGTCFLYRQFSYLESFL